MNETRVAGAWLVAITWAAATCPARATPGLTLAQFQQWSGTRSLLRGLVRTKDEMSGRPAYDLLTADHGVAWHFHASTNGTTVESESLGLVVGPGEPGSTPILHAGNGYGFAFFKSFYGAEIAHEYHLAKTVAVVRDTQSHVATTFYRGTRFGFETAAGYVTIATLPVMGRALAQLRTCSARPAACSE